MLAGNTKISYQVRKIRFTSQSIFLECGAMKEECGAVKEY